MLCLSYLMIRFGPEQEVVVQIVLKYLTLIFNAYLFWARLDLNVFDFIA